MVLGLIAIPIWQSTFYESRHDLNLEYQIEKSYGAVHQKNFSYFFYTLGMYPVNSVGGEQSTSSGAARAFLKENLNQVGLQASWERAGVYFLFPHYILGGDIRAPSFIPANAIGLTLALIALFVAFWVARQEILGCLLIVAIGSSPMLLAETYATDNLFAWHIIPGLFVLSLHVPFIATHRRFLTAGQSNWRRWILWLAPIITGLILGTMYNVRTPVATAIGGAMIVYAFHAGFELRRRAILIALLGSTFVFTATGWNVFFDHVSRDTISTLQSFGGPPPDPKWQLKKQHPFWHPIWIGLGDFDDKYGYLWEDSVAYSYASGVLEKKFAINDSTPAYLKSYSDAIRDRVLNHIRTDPIWYMRIIGKRIWTALFENTPPTFSFGAHQFSFSYGGIWFAIPICLILILAIYCRAWAIIGTVAILAAAGGSAIIVTSGAGYKYIVLINTYFYALLPLIAIELAMRMKDWHFERSNSRNQTI